MTVRVAVSGVGDVAVFVNIVLRSGTCCRMEGGASEEFKRENAVVVKVARPVVGTGGAAFGWSDIHVRNEIFSAVDVLLKRLSDLPHVAGTAGRTSAFAGTLQCR